MAEISDRQLLAEYVSHNSQEAFATLVRRHINLVYAAAFRQVGDFHKAQEVTQVVFLILAARAARLKKETILSGWLYQTARLASASFLRGERRRQHREHEAFMQSTPNDSPAEPGWEKLAPLLDEAMGRLGETDRNAIVLRFFEVRPVSEVAVALGLEEWAVRKRLERAVEKLRKFFIKRGVAISAVAICATLSASAAQAAPPATLAVMVAATAATKGAAATSSTLTLLKTTLKLMTWTKMKTAVVIGVGLLLAAGTATVTIKQIETNKTDDSWRVENISSEMVDQAAPQIELLPTKFPLSEKSILIAARPNSDKVVGIRVAVADIAWVAYHISPGRMIFATTTSQNQYDFISTLPEGSSGPLQKELKNKLGLVGHRETRNMDVLLLKMQNRNAPGLKPPTGDLEFFVSTDGDDARIKGVQSLHNIPDFFEKFLGRPVIDQTGMAQNFSIDLQWKELGEQDPNHNGLKQALLDQLGLVLVPSREPVEMLVMEKVKN